MTSKDSYVLVVNEKNLVERRSIKTGPLVDNLRAIEEGLNGKGVGHCERYPEGCSRAPGDSRASGSGACCRPILNRLVKGRGDP